MSEITITATQNHNSSSRWLRWGFSLILIWQSLAILIGPAPGSYLMGKVYPIFKPYLVAFHLNNEWGFFAPDPAKGTLLRYIVTDGENNSHVYKLTEALNRSDTGFLRFTSLFLTISRDSSLFVESAGEYLCQRHTGMAPKSIQFFMGHQQPFTHNDYLSGNRPLDDQYMYVEYFQEQPCKDAQ